MQGRRDQDKIVLASRRRGARQAMLGRGVLVPVVLAAGVTLAACGGGGSSATPPSASSSSAAHGSGQGGGKGSGGGGGLAAGQTVTVQSVNGSQLSVTTKSGATKTVIIGASTVVTQNGQTSSASAIKAGQRLLVKGTRNAAGQILATSIAIQ